jgi:EAL domain-containing protein (putative c-di-GMP-specific phosphodiesterase class I)
VLAQVNDDNRYAFDQNCRVKAITLAAKLGLDSILSINFLCNAIYRPEICIRTTLETAQKTGFPTQRIMFEFTESERMSDCEQAKRIIDYYREAGFITGIDDFGAGYSGLNLLADFHTNIVKIDMGIIRNINADQRRQVIVKSCVKMLADLGAVPLAEGIETEAELHCLADLGVELMQGYYFAKPEFETLPEVTASAWR